MRLLFFTARISVLSAYFTARISLSLLNILSLSLSLNHQYPDMSGPVPEQIPEVGTDNTVRRPALQSP